ncbi:MAG: cytochrome C6 [Synechococcus sp. ARS1019]|nr:cytochrome C6 [Synechococcus sp. ARS1019]|tara:strand:+ start:3383 stop:3736 length:354 start_codon:yes stop_codon:yes gene_type:complete
MRRLAKLLATITAVVALSIAPAAQASTTGSIEQGEQIFAHNCAACHMGGGNVIQASRTLKIGDLNEHLDEYRQTPLEAIEHQIEDGKNAMPAYADKLSEEEIIAVATFVEHQAEQGW